MIPLPLVLVGLGAALGGYVYLDKRRSSETVLVPTFRELWENPRYSDGETIGVLPTQRNRAARERAREQLILDFWATLPLSDRLLVCEWFGQNKIGTRAKRLVTFFIVQEAASSSEGPTPGVKAMVKKITDSEVLSEGSLRDVATGAGFSGSFSDSVWGFCVGQHMPVFTEPAVAGVNSEERLGMGAFLSQNLYDAYGQTYPPVAVYTPKDIGWDSVDLGMNELTMLRPLVPFDKDGRLWLYANCLQYGDQDSIGSMLGVFAEDMAAEGDDSFLAVARSKANAPDASERCDFGGQIPFGT